MRVYLAALGMAFVAACATPTPYGPALNSNSGYSEQQIENNRWRVTFAGNSLTERSTVETYLLYRAAELTDQQGYDHFFVVERDTDVERRITGSRFNDPFFPHFRAHYRYFHPRFGWYGAYDPFWGSDFSYRESTEYEASAEIVLGRGPKPGDPAYFDAEEVLVNLSGQIQRAAPPS